MSHLCSIMPLLLGQVCFADSLFVGPYLENHSTKMNNLFRQDAQLPILYDTIKSTDIKLQKVDKYHFHFG